MHSQRLNEAPLELWVIAESSGENLYAHYNCMAGLAEVCTHVTSLLFWTEISVKIRESSTVTDWAAYWVAPSNPSHLQPPKIHDINFWAQKKKSEILHCIQDDQQLDKSKGKKEKNVKERLISKPAQNELHEFLLKLNQSENKPEIL